MLYPPTLALTAYLRDPFHPGIFIILIHRLHRLLFPPCRLHGINSFLQLIRSRYVTSLNDSGSSVAIHHPKEPTAKFQLAQLEQDIIATFIAGKPYIHNESPSQLRTLFKFKSSDKDTDGIHFKYVYSIEKGIY